MKKSLAIVFILLSIWGVAQDDYEKNLPRIEFKTLTHNFGDIAYNSLAEYNFVFKNTGKGPLIIKNAKAS